MRSETTKKILSETSEEKRQKVKEETEKYLSEMNPKEKAEQLVKLYYPYANGYVGSSFMTGTEYPDVILKNAKLLASLAIDEIIKSKPLSNSIEYWDEVKK